MSQQDVLLAVEGSGKVGLKAAIQDLCKEGGAIDLEAAELAAKLPAGIGPAVVALVVPFAKQLLLAIAEKI